VSKRNPRREGKKGENGEVGFHGLWESERGGSGWTLHRDRRKVYRRLSVVAEAGGRGPPSVEEGLVRGRETGLAGRGRGKYGEERAGLKHMDQAPTKGRLRNGLAGTNYLKCTRRRGSAGRMGTEGIKAAAIHLEESRMSVDKPGGARVRRKRIPALKGRKPVLQQSNTNAKRKKSNYEKERG